MANTLNIKEVTLAQISNATNVVNTLGAAYVGAVKQSRNSVYEPMVVRVTNHPADVTAATDVAENMALFLSERHGEPWIMVGHQTEHLIHPVAGVANAPIVGVAAYHTIYPNHDYTTFE